MSEAQRVDFQGSDEAWPVIGALFARMQALPESGTPRTNLAPRQIDLAQTAGHRIYIQSHALLGFAYEHHQAFLAHINTVGFGPRAPFNLLHPVLESSLWALWLLDPHDSATRRKRALQYEIHDFKAEMAYLDELGKRSGGLPMREAAAERQAHAGKSYREEAAQLGLDYAALSKANMNLTDEIPKMQRLLDRPRQGHRPPHRRRVATAVRVPARQDLVGGPGIGPDLPSEDPRRADCSPRRVRQLHQHRDRPGRARLHGGPHPAHRPLREPRQMSKAPVSSPAAGCRTRCGRTSL